MRRRLQGALWLAVLAWGSTVLAATYTYTTTPREEAALQIVVNQTGAADRAAAFQGLMSQRLDDLLQRAISTMKKTLDAQQDDCLSQGKTWSITQGAGGLPQGVCQ